MTGKTEDRNDRKNEPDQMPDHPTVFPEFRKIRHTPDRTPDHSGGNR